MPMMPSDPFGGAADRIRQMQQARQSQAMMPEPPTVQTQFDLDLSPNEMDVPDPNPMPSQAQMDDLTRHMQANYTHTPNATRRDMDGAMTFGPQFARTPPNYRR
jgi:hypothetical protein